MKKKHFKVYIVITIIILIIGISIAYATLSQTLKVNSTTTVQSSQTSWNIVLTNESCYGRGYATTPTIKVNGTTVTIADVILKAPYDYFACTFNVENKGEVNAKVQSFISPAPTFSGTGTTATEDEKLIEDNLWRLFQWDDTKQNVKTGDLLPAKGKREIRLAFGIPESMTTLPTNPVTTSSTFSIKFEQA